jgi:hypothetical protein
LVGGIGLCQSVGRIVVQVGLNLAIDPTDLVEAGLSGFAGGHLSLVDPVGEFRNGDSVKHRRFRMEQAIGPMRKRKGAPSLKESGAVHRISWEKLEESSHGYY